MKLSEIRTGVVKKYLIENGIDNLRVSSIGYGDTN
jgi:outer membrane protein OmpA-like peptidoglycan-associated protein